MRLKWTTARANRLISLQQECKQTGPNAGELNWHFGGGETTIKGARSRRFLTSSWAKHSLLQNSESNYYYFFLEVLSCNRCFGSRNTFVLFHVIWEPQRIKWPSTHRPPRGAPDDWTLGPSLRTVFYKTWTNPRFVSRCSSFINIKNDPVKLWQCWSINYQSDMSEREYNTYFSSDGENVESRMLKTARSLAGYRQTHRGAGVWTMRRKRTWVGAADRGRWAARQHDGTHKFSERRHRRGCLYVLLHKIHELL